ARDHLDERAQARRAEVGPLARAAGVADLERALAQAVPVLEQQDLLAAQVLLADLLPARVAMVARDREHERLVEQRQGLGVPEVGLEREQEAVEVAGLEGLHELGGP